MRHFFSPQTRPLSFLRSRLFSTAKCVSNDMTLKLTHPVVQIYGANTDVGKTVLSTGLVQQALMEKFNVNYIKPLQTGGPEVADVNSIEKYNRRFASDEIKLECDTLYSWADPVSPHLAALNTDTNPTDKQVLKKLADLLEKRYAERDLAKNHLTVVETAGGVCSPTPALTPQADVYRAFRLPVFLVGDGKLGGISTTLSAFESLHLRGYDVLAIALTESPEEKLENAAALSDHFHSVGRNVPVFGLKALPPSDVSLHGWFEDEAENLNKLLSIVNDAHANRVEKLKNLASDAQEVVWWPFTQHEKFKKDKITVIDSAFGDTFSVFDQKEERLKPMFDSCASWWTQGIGHGNPEMAKDLSYAASRYGHVMFPENAHEPSVELSRKLLRTVGKDWAARVFFSDDGSTAVEVGIKMAFRKYLVDHGLSLDIAHTNSDGKVEDGTQLVVLAQENCYHGDTLGVMQVAEPSVFNAKQHAWFRQDAAVIIRTPTISCHDGQYSITLPDLMKDSVTKEEVTFASKKDIWEVAQRESSSVAQIYRHSAQELLQAYKVNDRVRIGALLIEPVLIGAGGMLWVDPLFQRILVQECRAQQIPVIYDEVFSGFWRLGIESARELLQIDPDIACYAKLLTGGVVPLSTTLASKEVFDVFSLSTGKDDALLHGHSFTANPIGCAAALFAMKQYDSEAPTANTKIDAYWDIDRVEKLSQLPIVSRSFSLGTVFAVELQAKTQGYASTNSTSTQVIADLREEGVFARCLGNVIYLMASPLTSNSDCHEWLDVLENILIKYECEADEASPISGTN